MNIAIHESNRRILLIDDNRAIHHDFRKVLLAENGACDALNDDIAGFFDEPQVTNHTVVFELDSAHQGEEGVKMLRHSIERNQPYAMAFVDMRMPPGIDGLETVIRLWDLYPELQIVICTAYSDYSCEEMAAKIGHSDRLLILKKPFEAVEVFQLAHTLTTKWAVSHALAGRLADLEVMVNERTRDLVLINQQLRNEISERSRAEARIRDQAALLDKARDAILVCDLEDVVLYWNTSAERLYGWRAIEVQGTKITEIFYRDRTAYLQGDRSAYNEARRMVFEYGEWIGELVQKTKSGSDLTVECHWTLVRDDEGRPKSILSINTDITASKEIKGQLRRSQRMESIGLLAGGIAHDLNNVLAPIMMSIDILRIRFPDAEASPLLEILNASTERGAGMINQVLQFARGVEGKRMLVELSRIIRDIENVARETFPKSVRVRAVVASGLWCVSSDPTQMHQVLLNLCVNARDAMPSGGLLTITAANATLDSTSKTPSSRSRLGPYVCIEVADTGIGMSPAVIEKIFQPFFTTKELGKGTGLGLSTTLGIVKSYDGFIEVESEPGQGSRIKIYLPAVVDMVAPGTSTPADLPCGSGQLVLIIDDESAIRTITGETLKEFGYRVLTASDGAEACAIFARQSHEIDAVLTDLMMPIMDGPATIRALRLMNPDLPIIAATGFSLLENTTSASKAGVQAFLSKPYCTETLLKALREILPVSSQSAAS